MKKKNGILLFVLSVLLTFSAHSQVYIRAVYPDGDNYPDSRFTRFDKLWLSREQPPLFFRSDALSGPSVWIDGEKLDLKAEEINPYKFYRIRDRIKYSLFIRPNIASRSFIIEIEMKKISHKKSDPHDVSLVFGIDIGNSRGIPAEEVYYPTFLRKESNTLWGCLTTPEGKSVAVACPQTVERISYLQFDETNQTIKIDLLSKENFIQPDYNQTLKWAFSIAAVPPNDSLKSVISNISDVPTIDLQRTYYSIGETISGRIYTKTPVRLTLTHPDGNETVLKSFRNSDIAEVNSDEISKPLPFISFESADTNHPGVYLMTVENEKGLKTTAGFTVFRKPREILRQEIERAATTPIPESADQICYADLLICLAGKIFTEYQPLSKWRYESIKNLFLRKSDNRFNPDSMTSPNAGIFLLNLALLNDDLKSANLIVEYFSKMQLPSGNIFYAKTKEDITSSSMLLSSFMAAAQRNRLENNTAEAEMCETVLSKALIYLKEKDFIYDETTAQKVLPTAEQFLEFSNSTLPANDDVRRDFFQAGCNLLRSIECHIQNENSSPFFQSTFNLPGENAAALIDPSAIYAKASLLRYEALGRETDLIRALNATASLINRSREIINGNSDKSIPCRFQAPLLLYEFLFGKAYIHAESPKEVRGYHCRIDSISNGTVNVVISDEDIRRVHIRTLEPMRFVFETADGVINKVIEQSGWVDLN